VEIIPNDTFTYYGCRLCRQTREFWDSAKGVIAVLDTNMTDEVVQQDKLVRINWLTRRALFDLGVTKMSCEYHQTARGS
jgi:hypothetical protein